MKQSIMWLALALLFAIGVALSVTADSFGPTATAEPTASATLVQTPQPVVQQPQPVVASIAKPAEPEVPVAMLDDVPPRQAIASEALARWYVEPGASTATRTAEAPVTPLPLAPATATTHAGQPAQTSKAGIKPPDGDARPARKPRDSNAQLPGKRRTTNARACGSPSRFTDLLRQLNIGSRCTTKRSAA